MAVMRRPRRSPAVWPPRATLLTLAAWTLAGGVARAQTAPPPEPAPSTGPAPTTAAPPNAPPPTAAAPQPPAPATPAPAPGYAPAAVPPPAPGYPPPYAYPYYPYPYYAYPPPNAYVQPPPQVRAAPDPEQLTIAATPPPGSTRVPAEDPQADRGVFAPTAYTHPKGTFYVSDYDLALVQLGYALTDDTQVSFTGVPPLGTERILILDITLKSTLYRGGLVRLAALGSTSGIAAKEVGVVGVGRVGGVAQLCLEAACRSSISVSSDLTLAGVLLLINSASGIFRVSRSVSFLAELDTLLPLHEAAAQVNGGLVGGGLRFHGTNWGFDASLMHVLGGSGLTLPLLALTYRSSP